jgi:hypothetical protein
MSAVTRGTPVVARIVPGAARTLAGPALGWVSTPVEGDRYPTEKHIHVIAPVGDGVGLVRIPPECEESLVKLAGEGRTLLFTRGVQPEPRRPRRVTGAFSLDLTTLEERRLDFEPRPDARGVGLAGSPDGRFVLVHESWEEGPVPASSPPGPELWRTTLTLVDLDVPTGRGPVWEVTVPYHVAPLPRGLDLAAQWSRDGSLIALSAHVDAPAGRLNPGWAVPVLDARDGRTVEQFPDVLLLGSCSWSPDDDRLVVYSRRGERDEAVLHRDSGRREPLMFMPEVWTNNHPHVYGFLDDERLLLGTQRGATKTVSAVSPAVRERERLLRWTNSWRPDRDIYPKFAQVPPARWLGLQGTA